MSLNLSKKEMIGYAKLAGLALLIYLYDKKQQQTGQTQYDPITLIVKGVLLS